MRKKRDQKTTRITLEFSLNTEEIEQFKQEIKSNLNGTLPVCVEFANDGPQIRIVKQGRGHKGLNSKGDRIAHFLAERINFQYIPAVRTARQANEIVEAILAAELREIEASPLYSEALEKIRDLQAPILEAFSFRVTQTLQSFIPSIKSVKFQVSDERRNFALRQSVDIQVDDGSVTHLESKGDGVQSLVALGLRRHAIEERRQKNSYIFAIEEPEAHLHPDAIHELRGVLRELATADQMILTTHSGILANRESVESNVIVRKSVAKPASDLKEIREALGIRSHDNFINAEVVLLVEGDEDKIAVGSVLKHRSEKIRLAMSSQRLLIDSLAGAGSLGAKVGLYRQILCSVHCVVDADASGRAALEKSRKAGLIEDGDYNFAMVDGKVESEFEDMVCPGLVARALREESGIDIAKAKPRNRKQKWSKRMSDVFRQCGKDWDELAQGRLKSAVANAVARNPGSGIASYADGVFVSLISALETKLK